MRTVRIVIVNYRTAGLVIDCLRSLAGEVCTEPGIRVTVVDNSSPDDSVQRLAAAIAAEGWGDWAELLPLDRNGGFAFGNNAAIRPWLGRSNAPAYFHLLNPDTIVRPGAVTALIDFLEAHPRAGIAGGRLENPDGSPQTSAFRFHNMVSQFDYGLRIGWLSRRLRPFLISLPPSDQAHRADWVSGASMMVRREVFERVGLMDEDFFLYFEETDFCRRAKNAGFQCWYVPSSQVIHLEGQSTGVIDARMQTKRMPRYWFASRQRYFRKHHGWVYALLTNLGFATGYALWRIRRRVQRKRDDDPPHFLWDFVRNSFV